MSVDIQKWKAEAHENAAKTMANTLQHSDSLAKVEQWRRRCMRNNFKRQRGPDSRQLFSDNLMESARTGLYQLNSINEVDSMCKNLKSLAEELQAVRECQKHQSRARR